ncbi:MAG TPA: tRNA (adenosine(37)-N6)-threonylcarbamoyltransferase complex ATPase subunit type 1 TsaE [Rhizomicrobium sp.]|jgi:tRNA threonylcarbamoyl adenosine modification protein YjeE|nr:tRNA (adenosine(37)-N6)-threonylcarbamoyltransferase complex ATPase subunit type 1 TsaE [Rhizomicrobium sp.]
MAARPGDLRSSKGAERGLEHRQMGEQSTLFQAVFPLPDLGATEALGARIARTLKKGDTVALAGDLGAGKTTLARAILTSLGVGETVPSPTFTLVQNYGTARLNVSHFDLYRLKSGRELDELGLDEALEQGAALVEWPERAEGRLPQDRLTVTLRGDSRERRASLSGPARWRELARG